MEDLVEADLVFFVNGSEIRVPNPDPEISLLYFVRNHLGLTGSKLGCGEGGCGACTLMLSKCTADGKVQHFAVNACLTPLCSVHGMAVTTVEGIGSTRTGLHPCQERIAKAHGSQCGFCTPGFVMAMYTLLRNNQTPSEEEIEETLHGNLCRCTGYRSILDGYKTFASETSCCGSKGAKCYKDDTPSDQYSTASQLYDPSTFKPLDPTQEPIFPAKLKIEGAPQAVLFKGPRVQWFRPVTLQQLLALRDQFPLNTEQGAPKYHIAAGSLSLGIQVKVENVFFDGYISCCHVPELNVLQVSDEGLLVGAAVTLTDLMVKVDELARTLPAHQTRVFSALLEMLKWFGSRQVRNVATVGGNLCKASSISDLQVLLVAARATAKLASVNGCRSLSMDASFYSKDQQTPLKANEVLISVTIPYTSEDEYFCFYKQGRRKVSSAAIVNAAYHIKLSQQSVVKEAFLHYGGLSKVIAAASQTEKSLLGREWNEELLEQAVQLLLDEFPLASDVPGGMPEYRRSLAVSFFFKFYWTIKNMLPGIHLAPELKSLTEPSCRPPAGGVQGFQQVSDQQSSINTIGRPLMHTSALVQASGEACYVDDIPQYEVELHAGLVLSTHTHAKISVDWSAALSVAGVQGYVSAEDVPGSNTTGTFADEVVFADGEVTHIGQVIGMVLAENRMIARRAAKLVKVSYTDLPSIITIKDAIAAESFYPEVRQLNKGDFTSAYDSSPLKLEGEFSLGGQEHFYMETNCCLAVPNGERDEMEIFSSTQWANGVQSMAAEALGIPANRISVRVKRVGGAFGGKISTACKLSTPAAVAANKYQRPIRAMFERDEDMIVTGGRHPFLARYKVGFNEDGCISALDVHVFSNGGASIDCSYKVLGYVINCIENVYNIRHAKLQCTLCRTNLPSPAAFRGYGRLEGMVIMEAIMSSVAMHTAVPPEKVRESNFQKEGDCTLYGQPLPDVGNLWRCWDQVAETSLYCDRKMAVESFNRKNRWTKQGMALVPLKMGLGIPYPFNQAGALVHVYTDGSVLVSHGGMEMGQGLHTKMIQVCSCLFNIPTEKIHILETSTGAVPNATSTSASCSTDLYGTAVKDACEQILERLSPVKASSPDAGWESWVKTAYGQRINLSAQGFYAGPNTAMNWDTGIAEERYHYFVYGAACSEVEVDCLTGEFSVLRTDIVSDVGDSINPAIDIGQIEGAFMQGLGLFTMEQCVYLEGNKDTQRGQLLTTGPSTYKIPTCRDIPLDFRVALLGRAPNPKAIFSSKGIGEPPLFLASSVFFAIQDAVNAARKAAGQTQPFHMDSPATCERIRMACSDHLTKQVNPGSHDSDKRWTIEAL